MTRPVSRASPDRRATVTGRLVLVATPIGNLADLSPRAVAALAGADAIVCEDTRRTGRLLQHAGVAGPRLLVANEHTEASCAVTVARLLDDGKTVAVVTDAGTPGISDPGERLVRAALDGGHAVSVVPGPAAAVAALVVSGLPTERWVMEGFLPRSGRDRGRPARRGGPASPARSCSTRRPTGSPAPSADLAAACGDDRPVALARELTKLHEEVWRGTAARCDRPRDRQRRRGASTCWWWRGAPAAAAATDTDVEAAVRRSLAAGLDRKSAVAEVAAALGVPKRQVYDAALRVLATP